MPFAIAAGHRRTAEAAEEILRAGGTAVDAAIAGALTACVAEPVLASLLGGGFLMVREPSGKAQLLDFFIQTPRRKLPESEIDLRSVEADFGGAKQVFHVGAASIGAPGAARGLFEAHKAFGVIPFPELAAYAARLAKKGEPLSRFQAGVSAIVAPVIGASAEALALYGDGEAPLKEGAAFINPDLADVIETYASEGDRFIHEGEVASALLSLGGGHLTAEDLRRYEARWRAPLEERRGEAKLSLNPPPSLGGALIAFALRLIERTARPADFARAFDATTQARIESALSEDPVAGARRLLAPDLAERWRKEVSGKKAAVNGTTHISVVDARGMGAALTLSNGTGSGMIAPGTGIMANNMLGEEDLVGSDLLNWRCDERLSSMMAPMAVTWPDGRFAMLGSGGSNRIRTALAQVAAHLTDRGMRPEEAVAAPRVHVEAWPEADFEDRLREDEREALIAAFPEARGWAESSMFFGGVHVAMREAKGAVSAAADERRDGVAVIQSH